MMGMYGFGPGAMLLSGLTMLLFWGGLIVLVVWAVHQFGGGRPAAEDPAAILRRRLAAGEITQEQYEQARRALQS